MYDLATYEAIQRAAAKEAGNLRTYLKDKEEPLTERWEIFTKVYNELDTDSCYFTIPDINGEEITYYDDLYCDKYQTIDYPQIVETLADKFEVEETDSIFNELKESMLQSGDGACVNDW